jgi:hypothetical protein
MTPAWPAWGGVAPATATVTASAAAGVWDAVSWAVRGVFAGAVQALLEPSARLLGASLATPYPLGAGAETVWTFTRDLALAGLGVVLLYAAVRHMLGPVLGLGGAAPAVLLGRLVAATAGAAFSLAGVRWLLLGNADLVQALLAAAGSGGSAAALLAPVLTWAAGSAAAVAVGAVAPAVLALACLAAALWVAAAYYLRAAEILLLTALAPVAAALWVLPEAAGVWGTVWRELVVAVFTQAVQVLVLWLAAAAGLTGQGGPLGGLLTTLALLVLLGRVRALLQALAHGGRPQGGWGALASWGAARGVSAGAGALLGRLARGVAP